MSYQPLVSAALGLSLAACSVPSHAQLILPINNGGFESGSLSPWSQGFTFDSGVWATSTTDPHSGNYCATVTGNDELRQDFAPVDASKVISATLWTRQVNTTFYPFIGEAVNFYYTDGTIQDLQLPTSTNWQKQDLTHDLLAGKSLEAISVFGFSNSVGPVYTYVDDISIQAVPETSSAVSLSLLVALGAGAVLAGARKRRGSPSGS